MSIKNAKKFGLWTAISLIVGSIMGIGIFFKNISIFHIAGGNGTMIILAWVLSGLIALGAALSFAEIGTGVSGKAGLSNYAYKLINKKFGRLCKIVEPTFYHSILIFALTCYASEALLQAVLPSSIKLISVHMGLVLLLSAGIYFFFWGLTIISTRTVGLVQNVSVVIKFIPLVVVAIVGLTGIGGTHTGSVFSSGHWITEANKQVGISSFSFSALIMILPASLFAFDGFIHVTNIATDIENPKKNIPLGIIIGMSAVLILYLLITLGQLLTGHSMPANLIASLSSDQNTKDIISRLLNIFIAIAALGVCNGFVMSQIRSTEAAIEDNLLLGSNLLKKRLPRLYGPFYTAMIYIIMFIIVGIPTMITNTDSIIDCITNFPVLYFFILYTILIIAQIWNRQKIKKVSFKRGKLIIERNKNQKVPTKNLSAWLFYPLALISIVGITTVLGFEFFYVSIAEVIAHPMNTTDWGVFHKTLELRNYQVAIIFFTTLVTFIGLPVGVYKFQVKTKQIIESI